MKLSLFTPEQTLLDKQPVQEILVPSIKGYLGILPGHTALISLLKAGVLKYLPEASSQWEKLALGWGYLEVYQGDVRILAESAASKKSLDKVQTEKELGKILSQLSKKDLEPSQRTKLEKEKIWLEGKLEL